MSAEKIKSVVRSVVYGGVRKNTTLKDIQSIAVTNVFLLLCMTVAAVTTALNLARGNNHTLVLFTTLVAGFMFTTGVYLRFTGRHRQILTVISVFGLFSTLFLLFSGGEKGTGHLWSFILPPVLAFAFGLKRSIAIIVLHSVATGIVFFSPLEVYLSVDYSSGFRIRFIMAFLSVGMICTGVEYLRKRAQRENDSLMQKRLEEARQRLDLEGQLRHSQKIEAIGRLAGGVAHDINNMLTGIMGFASLIQMDLKHNDPQTEDIKGILTICRRARDLTGNLLGFARKGKYRRERIDLNKAAGHLEEILKRTISKNIDIEMQLANLLPNLEGDPNQIEQVLMNLCINAADAMNSVGTLTMRTSEVVVGESGPQKVSDPAPGRYVQMEVIDTGDGIDAETMTKVFEPFFTTKPQGEGTGLGLSMVYGAVRNHGGTVTLDSKPGKGTKVTLRFPALETMATKTASVSDPPPVPAYKGHGTVLLVDDEAMVRSTTERLLKKIGYNVILAQDGGVALDVYLEKHDEIDLVLLDLAMPVIDGPETFQKLREINPGVRVLLFSGFSINAVANGLIEEGALGFIQKPFQPEKLADAVAKGMSM